MSSNSERLKRVLSTQPGKSMVVGGVIGAAVGLATAASLPVMAVIGVVVGGYVGRKARG